MDKIEIIGDKIWLGGYVVAEIKEDAPPSVLEDFKRALERKQVKSREHW